MTTLEKAEFIFMFGHCRGVLCGVGSEEECIAVQVPCGRKNSYGVRLSLGDEGCRPKVIKMCAKYIEKNLNDMNLNDIRIKAIIEGK